MRYSYRKTKKSYRVKRKKKILKSRFFWFSLLILISFLAVSYFICFHSFFQIKEVEISGNQKVSSENIKSSVEINLPRKILLSNSKSIFLIDLKKVEESILRKFPQVNRVNFDRDFPSKLIILIEEKKPVAILEKGEDSYFLDQEGVIFEKVLEKRAWLIIKDPNLNQDIGLGEGVIERGKLSQILEIQSELKELKIEISLAEIVNQQRVNVRTLEGWDIYFNLEDDISRQVFNLDLVLKEKISSEQRGNLEYVDLRFGNQVYYK